jgi:hypothetical protein
MQMFFGPVNKRSACLCRALVEGTSNEGVRTTSPAALKNPTHAPWRLVGRGARFAFAYESEVLYL